MKSQSPEAKSSEASAQESSPKPAPNTNTSEADATGSDSEWATVISMKRHHLTVFPVSVDGKIAYIDPVLSPDTLPVAEAPAPGATPAAAAPTAPSLSAQESEEERIWRYASALLAACPSSDEDSDDDSVAESEAEEEDAAGDGPTSAPATPTAPAPTRSVGNTPVKADAPADPVAVDQALGKQVIDAKTDGAESEEEDEADPSKKRRI
ncbi:hypothetical protein V8F20_001386 [Naviculisporaceae sp. PSN 640]